MVKNENKKTKLNFILAKETKAGITKNKTRKKRSLGYYFSLSVLILSVILIVAVGVFIAFDFVAGSSASGGYQPGQGARGVTLTQYIIGIYNYVAGTISLLSVGVMIFAGYRYMAAMGDPQPISEAKAMAIGAIAGLILVLLSYLLLSTLNPATVSW